MAEDAMKEAAGQAEEQIKVWEENRLKRLWGAGRGAASFRFGSPAVGGYSASVGEVASGLHGLV